MQTRKLAFLTASLLAAAMLWGCGSSGSGGSDVAPTPAPGNVQALGVDNCQVCHPALVAEWLAGGGHSNPEALPDLAYFGNPAAECAVCHDPNDQGGDLLAALGETNRPVVGCEGCHGGGSAHRGVGPLPFANPDFERCGTCHNALSQEHVANHPLGLNILDNYKLSRHAGSVNGSVQSVAAARCAMCHSDEGFKLYAADFAGLGHDALEAALENLDYPAMVSPVQCRTCHDSHNGGALRAAATMSTQDVDPDPLVTDLQPVVEFSAGYNLCTTCHQVFVTATWDEASGRFTYQLDGAVYSDPTLVEYHNPAINPFGIDGEIISDSHFAGTDAAGNAVTGYNINAADEFACLNCHDAHGATKFEQVFAQGIAEEWGNEAEFHGAYQREAFIHEFSNPVCLECHNGTEFVKVTEGLDPADLDLDQQGRVVACVACHDLASKAAAGDAFELGAVRELKDADGNVLTAFTFPSGQMVEGVGENALCLTCHSGRNAGSSVDDEIAAKDLDGDGVADGGGTFRFQNIHYRAAGATLFGNMAGGGYEFAGKAYASKFEHVASNDLCVECHNVHDGRLHIASPGFGPTGCVECHANIVADPATDYAGAVAQVRDIRMTGSLADYDGNGLNEGIYHEVQGLKARLLTALNESGVSVLAGYPYFSNLTNAAQLQAAYNYQVVDKDPGSYAHNPSYIIELLYDSLEAMATEFNGTGGFTDINMSLYTRDDAGHFEASAEAFRHWDADGEVPGSCSNCHSSEGASFFIANGAQIDPADYTPYTKGISSGLACESCHNAPFDGTVRTVASVTFPNGLVADGTSAPLLASDSSLLCAICHQGRASGQTVADNIAAGSFGFVNRHYFSASAIYFGTEATAGFEYPGRTYNARTDFEGVHPATLETCADCHLRGSADHGFKPLLADCSGCHSGITSFDTLGRPFGAANVDYDGDTVGESFQGEIDGMTARLLTAIQAYATAAGSPVVYGPGSYPYWFNDSDADGIADADETNFGNRYQAFDAVSLPAAYNYHAAQDPCGDIHNYKYVIQTLYDSMDDLDNGAQDNSIIGTRP